MDEDSDPIRVLFVDDDADFLDIASRLLERENDRISVATEDSPPTVPERISEVDPDCIVSDYNMAEMDGIELLKSIRSDYPTLPAIIFTAKGDEETAGDAISVGATDYVINTGAPDQYAVLASRIESVVGRRRSEQIATQHRRIDSIYRYASQTLIDRPTKDSIERGICDALADFEGYTHVWIGDIQDTGIHVRAQTPSLVDSIEMGSMEWNGREYAPEMAGIATETVQAVNDVPNELSDEQVHPLSDHIDLRSLVTIPITARSISYGGLTIYSNAPHLFTDREVEMLTDLGDLLGFGLSIAEQREGLFSYTMTEIELAISDRSADLNELAETLDTNVRLEGAIPEPDGTFTLFLDFGSTIPDPDAGRAALERILGTNKAEMMDTADPTRWAVADVSWFGETFTHHGIQIIEVVADGETIEISLESPSSVNVRDIIDVAEFQFSSVEITAKRQRSERSVPSPGSGSALVDLTSRQRDVLETAYRRGFFDWPREKTAKEVAETLDISQPAFSRHIRRSEQKVFTRLFERSPDQQDAETPD